jgi:hypothetical protein
VARDLAIADAELRLLGLLEPGQSLEQVATDVSAGALAYYDPRSEELFLLGDAVPAGPELAEFILAHELTHALEDERFGLPRSHGLSDDRTLAEAALVEGTATALMIRYARRNLDPIALAAELAGLDSGATAELPRFAEAEVEFTYLEGAEFADELIRLAGDWTLVDYAYEKRLPATTEQVLHLDKYLEREPAARVALPPAAVGLRLREAGTFGELDVRALLGAFAVPRRDRAAAGWGGGRTARYTGPAGEAIAVVLTWDTALDAAQWDAAAAQYLRAAFGGSATGVAFTRSGRRTSLVVGPDAPRAEALARALTGQSRAVSTSGRD